MQIGPQRVFVDLAYTPRMFRGEAAGFVSHTGLATGATKSIFLDEQDNILLDTELGIGLLKDRELPAVHSECRHRDDQAVEEQAFLELMSGTASSVFWQKRRFSQ